MYYDGVKLLSLKDIDGEKPEIFMSTSNRTGGKTTYWDRWAVNRFKKNEEKFCLLYRFKYELDDVEEKFFKDIKSLFFPSDNMTSKSKGSGIYRELYLNDISCGYAICLNSADGIKKQSHQFSDVTKIIFDEFQSETNHYCDREVEKFLSIHTSLARGQGEQRKYLPVIMISNPVSLINPYYTAMGISSRLNDKTKFLRGKGFVLEQGFIESASEAIKSSGVAKAFSAEKYIEYATQNIYLNDNKSFIEKPKGKSRYLASVRYMGQDYAIREFADAGVLYCDNSVDKTFPLKISVTTADHTINYVMLKRSDGIIANLRWYFEKGCFRFKDLKSKEALLATISY